MTVAPDTPFYPISTVAYMLGVSVMTLRLYEKRGLILIAKLKNGHRAYSERDVARLRCIRTTITQQKISIEGIRAIQSLIPCYETVQCPRSERLRCPAYTHPQAGCWTIAHTDNICAQLDCKTCPVYEQAADCHTIRNQIRTSKNTEMKHSNSSTSRDSQ